MSKPSMEVLEAMGDILTLRRAHWDVWLSDDVEAGQNLSREYIVLQRHTSGPTSTPPETEADEGERLAAFNRIRAHDRSEHGRKVVKEALFRLELGELVEEVNPT